MHTNSDRRPPTTARRAARWALAALTAGSLLLAACGDDDTDAVGAADTAEDVTTTTSTSTTAPAGDAEALVGTWKGSNGTTWEITEGLITATLGNGSMVESTYTVTGSTLELQDVSGPLACPPEQIGIYEWEIDTGVLTVTAVSDPCGRKNGLDGTSFERVEPGDTAAEDPISQGEPGDVAAGDTVETPRLGGLRFVVPEERFIYQAPGLVTFSPHEVPAFTDLVRVVETLEGEPIDTVDTVVELIDEASLTFEELKPTTIAGHEARVFDYTAEKEGEPRPDDAVFRFEAGGTGGWGPIGAGRVWLLDTDRGILLLSGGSFQPAEADLADAIAEAEAVFATLELIDLES